MLISDILLFDSRFFGFFFFNNFGSIFPMAFGKHFLVLFLFQVLLLVKYSRYLQRIIHSRAVRGPEYCDALRSNAAFWASC